MVADLTHTGHPFCGGDLEVHITVDGHRPGPEVYWTEISDHALTVVAGIGGPTKPSRQQQDTIMCAKLGP